MTGGIYRYGRTIDERFWSRVEPETTGCWRWTGRHSLSGYGMFDAARPPRAFRWSYEQLVGAVPDGLVLDHLCRNPGCVNPTHLEPVTHRENTLRGTAPTAVNARKTECKHGHSLSEDNVYRPPKRPTTRHCRTCRRLRQRLDWLS